MKLTATERTRILEGGYKPLHREEKPDIEPRTEIVVSWTRPRAFSDDEMKHVFRPQPERAMWITVTNVVRRTKGGWAIYFDVTDRRHPDWYLGKAGYTRSKRSAIDDLAAPIDKRTQARLTVEARQANMDRREKDAEAQRKEVRKQERAIRDRLRDTLQTMPPSAQIELLASFERLLSATVHDTDKAA